MAKRRLAWRKFVLGGVCAWTRLAQGLPDVAFPFNSQVPTVARVGLPYTFQFSSSTFAPEDTNFTYSISDQPAWLSLNGPTRTLCGTPQLADVGVSTFTITAADIEGATHMACTLIISTDPAPQIQGDIGKELAATVNLSSTQPPVATILPSTPFHFQFQKESFIDIVKRQLYYYATLTDHTPLPAWLQFDAQTLTFSGTTPLLSAFPQSWEIEMIVSDVAGFGGASICFTIAIAAQQLVFVPAQQFLNISAGAAVDYTNLSDTLFRNGKKVLPASLQNATATVPAWLSFDSRTLSISGTAPAEVKNTNISITVQDGFGDRAVALLTLIVGGSSNVFGGVVGTLIVHSGQEFIYHLPDSLFRIPPIDLVLTLPVAARWLHFDPTTRVLSGKAPPQTTSSSIQATLTARASTVSGVQTQIFTIDIIPTTSKQTATHPPTASVYHPGPTSTASVKEAKIHLNSGVVAAVILGALLAAAILVAILYFLRRRKERMAYAEPVSDKKRTISRPLFPPEDNIITVTTELQTDVEKMGDMGGDEIVAGESAPAPRIALDLPSDHQSRRMKWSKRFSRISHASSLGNGEAAVRADSNIPVWGRQPNALQHTPHDSFSLPTEMARSSQQPTELSPTKRALRRLRDKRPSTQSMGLGIDTGDSTFLPRHTSPRAKGHMRAIDSLEGSAAIDRSSAGSFSTRGTSVLSARPADFPRPPTRSGLVGFRSRPRLSYADASNRKSIRLVERSDSAADDRSMEEKRRSFIRKRASTSIASPLFANGARVPSEMRQNGRSSANASSLPSGIRRSKRGNSGLTTYSESSSVEPPLRNPRRPSSIKARFAFAPNYPRAITQSATGGAVEDAHGDSSSFYTTDEEISEPDYMAELNLPRHQRTWVVPGEASPTPTPPPAPPSSRHPSSVRDSTPPSRSLRPLAKWEERLREHSTSPMSTGAVTAPRRTPSGSPHRGGRAAKRQVSARRSKLGAPISLVSNDSLNRAKQAERRPRLVPVKGGRPVSVEKVRRLSSLTAETEDARPGSEMFEALEGAGLMPPSKASSSALAGGEGRETVASQKSNLSGPAFL